MLEIFNRKIIFRKNHSIPESDAGDVRMSDVTTQITQRLAEGDQKIILEE